MQLTQRLSGSGRFVLWGLLSRPVRTASLVAALAAGVAATTLVATIVAGYSTEIERFSFGGLASTVTVRKAMSAPSDIPGPTEAEAALVAAALPDVEATASWLMGIGEASSGGERIVFPIYGVAGAYDRELDAKPEKGALLTLDRQAGGEPECLVGGKLARRLNVGEVLRINGVPCRVQGILGEPRSRPAMRYEESVIVPIQVVRRYFSEDAEEAFGELSWLTIFVRRSTSPERAMAQVDQTLRKHRGAPMSRPSPLELSGGKLVLEEIARQRRLFAGLMTMLASVCLLASVVGYAASVSAGYAERSREFALRLTMGASRGDILLQAMLELALTGLTAGIFGVGTGALLAMAASAAWGWPATFTPTIGLIGAAAGMMLGLVCGAGVVQAISRVSPSIAARR